MVFVLGYPVSWFFTDESNKEWCKNNKIYDRRLDTGRSNWKFQEHFYNLWEQEKMEPKLGFDDMENWLKNSYEMWNRFFRKVDSVGQDEGKDIRQDKKERERGKQEQIPDQLMHLPGDKKENMNKVKKEPSELAKRELSKEDKTTLDNLKSFTKTLSNGVKSEINFFLKLKKDRERFRKMRNESSIWISEIGKETR